MFHYECMHRREFPQASFLLPPSLPRKHLACPVLVNYTWLPAKLETNYWVNSLWNLLYQETDSS